MHQKWYGYGGNLVLTFYVDGTRTLFRCLLKQGRDAHNRGVTLVTWIVTLVAHSYMLENGGEVPGQGAIGASWIQDG